MNTNKNIKLTNLIWKIYNYERVFNAPIKVIYSSLCFGTYKRYKDYIFNAFGFNEKTYKDLFDSLQDLKQQIKDKWDKIIANRQSYEE